MRRFALLIQKLGAATKTNSKLEALVEYFKEADDRDKIWMIAIFVGENRKE